MPNPHRSRRIALGFFCSGWAALAAFFLAAQGAPPLVRAGLLFYSFWAVVIGASVAWFQHAQARAQEAFARGEGIIARWRVEAAVWGEFAAAEREWNRAEGALTNRLALPGSVPAGGVEVIVGRDAVQIGESIHRLTGGEPEVTDAILHELRPPVVELQLYYPGGRWGSPPIVYPPSRWALRFPAGANAREGVKAIVAHYLGDRPRQPDCFDGKLDGSELGFLSKCPRCRYETYRLLSHCPRCGSGLPSRRGSTRGVGWVVLVLGVLLSAGMGVFLYDMGPALLLGGDPSRFSGTPGRGIVLLGIFVAVELLGIAVMCRGLWLIKTGKRSHRSS